MSEIYLKKTHEFRNILFIHLLVSACLNTSHSNEIRLLSLLKLYDNFINENKGKKENRSHVVIKTISQRVIQARQITTDVKLHHILH